MSDEKNNSEDAKFLADLEKGIVSIIKSKKTSTADRIAAVKAGVQLAAIRHKISTSGEPDETGFFNR